MEVAEHEAAVFPSEVHAVAFAESEGFAIFAGFHPFHPCPVSVGFELLFPDAPEGVAVYIALVVLPANAGARGDTAVNEYRGDAETCCTLVEVIADLSFVLTEIALAAIRHMSSGFALGLDEVHELFELRIGQYQFGVLGCSTHRVDAEDAPIAYAEAP